MFQNIISKQRFLKSILIKTGLLLTSFWIKNSLHLAEKFGKMHNKHLPKGLFKVADRMQNAQSKNTYYEPWSSGYGKRLMFQRSWVRFPAPYTDWTFFTFICCKNCEVCLKRPKINEKEAGVGQFFKKRIPTTAFAGISLNCWKVWVMLW